MKYIVEIKFVEDKFVEITLEDSVFRSDLDERGSPKLTESLKEKVPPYMPEIIGQGIKNRRQSPNQAPIHIAVSHEPWCCEKRETGRCNCNPDLRYLDIREYREISGEKLTCKMCEESSTGEIHFDVVHDDSASWERFWIQGGDMFYWLVVVTGFDFRLLICHLCMINRSIEFPDAIEWTTIRGTTGTEARGMEWKVGEEETTHAPESAKRLTEAQTESYPKKGRNEPSENKQRKHEVNIKDDFVEVKRADGQMVFIFAIDERGLPYFPEWVKGQVPLYVTELAQKTTHHKLWCAEIDGFGMCDCVHPMAETSEERKIAC